MEKATFAAGCFWGVEYKFSKLKGVISTKVGYTGGIALNPDYEDVCSGETGHAEAVEIEFNPDEISYQSLLEFFWSIHNPTTLNRQGFDVGTQYRSAIFYHTEEQKKQAFELKEKLSDLKKYHNPIVTEILPASVFWNAEEYHQKYLDKRGKSGCDIY